MKTIKIGMCFYDESNARFLTVDSVGVDPNCFCCIQEEFTEDGDDLVVTGRVLMRRNELLHMKEG